MPALVDPQAEVLTSNLPQQVLDIANRHVQAFSASVSTPDHDWAQPTFAPTARYIHDPAYKAGAAPAYVELRVLGPRGAQDGRGYLLVSLTEEDYPVPEFATKGGAKTDGVTQAAAQGTVSKFMRFGPSYVVGEDASGARLCALGTEPLKATGSQSSSEAVVVVGNGSGVSGSAGPARVPFNGIRAASYQDLKQDCQTSPLRQRARALRARDTTASWRLTKGIRNPTLLLNVGETQAFITDKLLADADEAVMGARELARILVLPKGGFQATGVNAGSMLVRVLGQDGSVDLHTLTVRANNAVQPRDLAVGDPLGINIVAWVAGSGWDGDERQFDQLKSAKWGGGFDGCGPTALAMLFGWWDANGVPSAFYQLESGFGDAHNFRFNYESLRDPDAPKNTDAADSQAVVIPVYDDLMLLGNTITWGAVSEEASTPPDQMVSAYQEYMGRIHDALPSPQNEFGQGFVWHLYYYAHVGAPGGETDWKHSGKLLVNGIKAGFPGVTGIGLWAWDLHYPLAYGYMIFQFVSNGDVVNADDFFLCNMGWGPYHAPEYQRAHDVWFGLSTQLRQIASPQSPNDTIATALAVGGGANIYTRRSTRGFQQGMMSGGGVATWKDLPLGEFVSGPAACASSDGSSVHVFGRGDDNRIWRAHSPDGGGGWDLAWDAIGAGVFTSSPAACVSTNGQSLHVFGRGHDNRIWRAHSPDGGSSWDLAWDAIGQGTFVSGPAGCVSADGQSLHVFGRGTDSRIWRAHSSDGGSSWDLAWDAIGQGTFVSNPAACISADGHSLHVFGRGDDGRIWHAHSPDGGTTWNLAWDAIGEGTFVSSPAVAMSGNGQAISVFGVGKDLRVWRAHSPDDGASWLGAWAPIDGGTVF